LADCLTHETMHGTVCSHAKAAKAKRTGRAGLPVGSFRAPSFNPQRTYPLLSTHALVVCSRSKVNAKAPSKRPAVLGKALRRIV